MAIVITYIFNFNQPDKKVYELHFDEETMNYLPQEEIPDQEWIRLDHCKCSHCPLDSKAHKYCPVAADLHQVATHFAPDKSFKEMNVGIKTEDRSYLKTVPLQDALHSIFGLIMATAGCPHMEFFKSMARFHLPFATYNETIVRALSMYLINQYFRSKKGLKPDWELVGLERIYSNVNTLNKDFIRRLRTISQGDADKNAIVMLDTYSSLLAIDIESNFTEIEKLVSFKQII